MSEDLVNIEVNGTPLQARKGQMLIEVTDAAGITVPRFCYHKKLSIAANCRMCLVEVEKAPKPLPACATPVMDGMKVQTRSPKALAAQKGTMEFLLINHPLDCPICDQGGECELQDVAMGYGGDVSRYVERKRVVKDKDIGPLVATEMTRCIHCTRCVRFGEEIAGLREMGATGRGENTEIGTYVRKSLASELSGNIIDLCPVGALTAKPSRYTARSWEMSQHAGIAGHDGIGSSVWHHVRYGKIVRTVPRENEAVNEVWLSDRDRFSYEGLYSSDRATQPMVRAADGALAITGWEAALEATAAGLKAVIAKHGAAQVGMLVSPSATLEELFLAQKLARGLGIASIDHRLRQIDFTAAAGGYPSLGLALADVPRLDAALVIGSNVRMELPLFAHHLRQSSLKGGKIAFLNPVRYAQTLDPAAEFVVSPAAMVGTLARLAAAVAGVKGVNVPAALAAAGEPSEAERGYAETLAGAGRAAIFLGQLALSHPQYAQLQAIAGFLARSCGATVGYLAPGANAAGASLAGALPAEGGQDAQAMLAAGLKGYVLIGIEPEFDCAAPAVAARALAGAEFVVALGTHLGGTVEREADVVLPVAACVETSGTFVNLEGRWQDFQAVARAPGQVRPGWKVLRVLGNLLGVAGFDHLSSADVAAEARSAADGIAATGAVEVAPADVQPAGEGLACIVEVPIYAIDPIVRRAAALQASPLAVSAEVRIGTAGAGQFGLTADARASVGRDGNAVVLPVKIDDRIPDGCVWVPAGVEATGALGAGAGPVEVRPA